MGEQVPPAETPAEVKTEETKPKQLHAVVNYLIQYECPNCQEELGSDEGGIDDANEFYSKHDPVKTVCGSCKATVYHDAVIVRTIPEGKP